MKYEENIQGIGDLNPDYMGFIFYPLSKRQVSIAELQKAFDLLDHPIKKVAVFVNEPIENIIKIVQEFPFDLLQLHGKETVEEVMKLKEAGFLIMKAFSIQDDFNWKEPEKYEGLCEFFLFDTSTPKYGGSGQKFDWKLLQNYQGKTPFFLSGGISVSDTEEILKLHHPLFYGIDINSRFEIEPGLKDIHLVQKFIKELSK